MSKNVLNADGNMVCKSTKSSLSCESVTRNFQKFRETGILCDVELVSGDTVLKAHRVVLSAMTPYFETMFTSGLEESESNRVFMRSIPPDVLPLIVDFIYTGEIVITGSTVQYLMDAGDMLHLNELSAHCADYLMTQLHPTNVLGIIRFAEVHDCMEVAEEAFSYAQTHWKAVSLGDEFLTIPVTLLMKLLSSDKLKIDGENQILNAALSWLEHDPASRAQHAVEVLLKVRLHSLKPHALKNALMHIRDPLIAEKVRVFQAVLEMEVNVNPRDVAECYLYVVGGHQRQSPTQIERLATALKFDVHKKEWKEIAPMGTPRSMLGVATLGGLLYAVGGENNDQALASGEVYDPITDKWTPIAPMQKARQCFGLAAINKRLFAFGGIGDQLESSVEAYDPSTDEWVAVGEMPDPRSHMSVAAYGEAVYVVGGRTHTHEYTSDVLKYTPERAEWRCLRPLLLARAAAAAVAFVSVLGPCLYVVGGQSTDNAKATEMMDCYDLQAEELNLTSEMTTARVGCVAGSMGDVLIVVGGDSGTDINATTAASVESYDPAQGQWQQECTLPQPRAYAGAAFI
ncbi:Kelch-like protein 3 [Eumeta japonica]|uniref:Kelch-like protein diablo n=1 Tax=Eumeta variegata TaxID=151549 RepID=A0A4C1XGL2_EUMVA|nr:Kelch-like protein 3 [Eumeta japonica]